MKCFYHQSVDAIGVCKSCGKGLCSSCLVDIDKGLACKGRCEEDVKAIISLVERNIRLSPVTSKSLGDLRWTRIISATFVIIMGILFLAWAVIGTEYDPMGIAIGVIFMGFGIFTLSRAMKIPAISQTDSQ